jgi:two-component system sensor histidine kinase and response regulator WspE
MNDDLSHHSMLEIFRVESENQTALLTSGLLELERAEVRSAELGVRSAEGGGQNSALATPHSALLEALMRAAHSLKGAARIVGLDPAVRIAHALEDCFVAAQHGRVRLAQAEIDLLFRGVDLLQHIGRHSNAEPGTGNEEKVSEFRVPRSAFGWAASHEAEIRGFLDGAARVLGKTAEAKSPPAGLPQISQISPMTPASSAPSAPSADFPPPPERVLRLTAENLNRLLGLAGEALVESRWLRPFTENMQRLKRFHADVGDSFHQLRTLLDEHVAASRQSADTPSPLSRDGATLLQDITSRLTECRTFMNDRLDELDLFDRRSAQLSHRLYLEVLRTRMRPFSDGVRRFPRMVRDLAKSLGKDVRLEIVGETTQVDRDILEKLETPLAHLLRNAVDHGCETPEVRRQNGKPSAATIRLEARHSAGMLLVVVSDDGAGVNPNQVREAIVRYWSAERGATACGVRSSDCGIPHSALPTPHSALERSELRTQAARMGEAELLEFLFLPGFTMKDSVTEISGRGVGLDVVQNMVKTVRGSIRVSSQPGRGTRFQLQLPLSLSVLRALLVEVGGEPYALPLGQISRTLRLSRARIEALEGHHHFRLENESIGLLAAHQIFECGAPDASAPSLPVVVLGDRSELGTRNSKLGTYGLVVDRFLGERELVVLPLDPRLGKVKDISAAALMEDGTPVLIVDVDDLLRSVEKLIAEGAVLRVRGGSSGDATRRRKRVLAVDDSLTVRELERKLLANHGYEADVAVDGVDGWNAVRAGHYDLVITDVDMPRMDGIELTRLIKQDPKLEALPVLIVSYKDRDEDRLRGLEAGADYYLTKGSFHDEKLLQAVADLIGEAGT